MNRYAPWIIGVALVAGAALIFWPRQPAEPPAPAAAPATGAVTQPEEPRPVAPAESTPPLPALDTSDADASAALDDLLGPAWRERYLVPAALIRQAVATVDNLPRAKLDMRIRVFRALGGPFLVRTDGARMSIDPANYDRYTAVVQMVSDLNMGRVADLYVRFYPLLQQAYEELGYPGRQFHTRLLEAIDDLLATPDLRGPVELSQPHVLYQFADPNLESLASGQKLLLRMGPRNAAALRQKLTELRVEIVARQQPPP